MKAYIEIEIEIDYDFSPPQRQSMTDPAFDAELWITEAMYNGVDILQTLSPSHIGELRDQAIEYVTETNMAENER
jgi:hypothetical protein